MSRVLRGRRPLGLLAVGVLASWPGVLGADYLRRVGPNPIRLAAPQQLRLPPPSAVSPVRSLSSQTNNPPAAGEAPVVAPTVEAWPGLSPSWKGPWEDKPGSVGGEGLAEEGRVPEAGPAIEAAPEADSGLAPEPPAVMPADQVELITPQMMMQFFESRAEDKRDRGGHRAMAVPLLFTPPAPFDVPSSKATYEVK